VSRDEQTLTPWAELLVRPEDPDEVIRRAYHAVARREHSDATADGTPGPRWHAVTAAYCALKTEALRSRWLAARAGLARLCTACGGLGVTWRRVGKDKAAKVCMGCQGAGRRGG